MTQAYEAAKAAHDEVERLTLTIQKLRDAARSGQAITEHDLHILNVDCRVLSVAVAKAFHAVAHQSNERRDQPRVRSLLVEAIDHA